MIIIPKFKVDVTETLVKRVLVEAEDQCEAEEKVSDAYNKEKIVLDYRDFDGAHFSAEKIDVSEYEELAELKGLDVISDES